MNTTKFSDLLVFMEQYTPRKVNPQYSESRLCDAFESHYLLCVFDRAGKAGSDKNLASKIQNVREMLLLKVITLDNANATEAKVLSEVLCWTVAIV